MKCFRVIVALLLSTLAAAGPLGASTEAADEATVDSAPALRANESTRVALVEVPVVVLDAQGRPVRGLRAEQIHLVDAGVERPIARFEVVDRAAFADLDAVEALTRIPAPARRRLLFLFDLELSSPYALAAARAAALEVAAEHLRPGDLAGVATLDALRGVRWLLSFGGDRRQLARAVRTLGVPGLVGGPPGGDSSLADPLRFTVEPPTELARRADPLTRPDTAGRAAEVELSRLVEQLERLRRESDRGRGVERATRWVQALGALGDALSVVDAGVEIVLFSEGFDARLFAGAGRSLDDGAPGSGVSPEADTAEALFGSSALRSELADALDALRRSGSLVHAVDPGGLRAPALGGGSAAGAPRRDALFHIAEATGGELVADTARLGDALSRLVAARDVVYLLSFYPPAEAVAGTWRPLRVTVDGPDVTVHHRAGYRLPEPFTELPAIERDLLAADDLVDARPRTELPLSLLATAFPGAAAGSYVPLVLELPAETLIERSELRERSEVNSARVDPVRLEVYVLATAADGRIAGVHAQTLEIDRRRLADTAIDRVQYYGHLELPPGRHLVRALVRDAATGRAGTASVRLEVPSWDVPVLLPPLVPDDAAGALRVRETIAPVALGHERVDDTARPYPFLVDGLPFVPSPSPRLEPASPQRLVLVLHGLTPPVRLDAHLRTTDGARHAVDLAPSVLDGPFEAPVHRAAVGFRFDARAVGAETVGAETVGATLVVTARDAVGTVVEAATVVELARQD